MRASGNVIEETLLAYALESAEPGTIDRRLARVSEHYMPLLDHSPLAGEARLAASGVALWSRRLGVSKWPPWASSGKLAIGVAGAISGWERVVGDLRPDHESALTLAREVTLDPRRASDLNPPFALAVIDRDAEVLTVCGDCVGAGRLYEMTFPGGTVWSNRLGALPLFAGVEPKEDMRAWQVMAACGWFLGDATPISGATKVGAGIALRVVGGRAPGVERIDSNSLRTLVAPRRARFGSAVHVATRDATGLVRDLARSSDQPLSIALTGGRDSRLSAAAAIAARVPAIFNTGDQVPGELEVVKELIADAPTPVEHRVYTASEEPEGSDGLLDRVRNIHLVHDGMRNPQELRRSIEVPFRGRSGFSLSGHGGELGHGFYYHDRKRIRRLRRGGEKAVFGQLERSARRKHSAASSEAYATYLEECRATIETAKAFGLTGPVLLDFFYLAQRLPHRSGLGARSGRASVCVTPGFVRGAFDLSPQDRVKARLHHQVIAELVPEWSNVPFFIAEQGAMPEVRRKRIWERNIDSASFEEILASPESWGDVFRTDAIREMWKEVRAGGGSADYEHVFDRVVWKAGFDAHVKELSVAAQGDRRS